MLIIPSLIAAKAVDFDPDALKAGASAGLSAGAKGAAVGMQAGGPIGAVVGAGLGMTAGFIGGSLLQKKNQKEMEEMEAETEAALEKAEKQQAQLMTRQAKQAEADAVKASAMGKIIGGPVDDILYDAASTGVGYENFKRRNFPTYG